jgi:phage terminase large subunit-like protein
MRKICKNLKDIPEVWEYFEQVLHGEHKVSKDTVAFVRLIEKRFADEELYFDREQCDRYMRQQKHFPFSLFPWEKCIFTLHNCVYRADGLLRWPTLFTLLGRGAGKNGYLSFESFCWITPANGVKEYDVDVFATSEDQAKTSFNDVYNILESKPDVYRKYFRWNREEIENLTTRSKFRFRTNSAKTKDGGRPGAVAFDEYHAYVDSKLIDVATTGLGKKPYPRKTIITTDGNVRGGVLDKEKEAAEDVLYHEAPDGGCLYFICRIDDDKEVDDEECWYKANPSLQYFPTLLEEIRTEYLAYKRDPISNASFIDKRMNRPRTLDAQSVTDWQNVKACACDIDEVPDFSGKDCVAGFDYTMISDFLSVGILFKHAGTYYWHQHSWVCRSSLDLPRIKAPLDAWERAGFLTFVDGVEIDPDMPIEWLENEAAKYNITLLGLDNFRFALVKKKLSDHGFDIDKGGANNIMLCKRVTINRYVPVIQSLFNNQKIKWGNDPMMSWYTWNTSLETDKGNLYFGKKEPHSRKTDGFMALVSAICAADDLADSAETSSFDDFCVYSY